MRRLSSGVTIVDLIDLIVAFCPFNIHEKSKIAIIGLAELLVEIFKIQNQARGFLILTLLIFFSLFFRRMTRSLFISSFSAVERRSVFTEIKIL